MPDDRSIELHLGMPIVIPGNYVPEPDVRIGLYRRLSSLTSEAAVEEFGEELADRFGSPPDAVRHLVRLAPLRQRCRAAGIERLEAGPKGTAITIGDPAAARRRDSNETSAGSEPALAWRPPDLLRGNRGAGGAPPGGRCPPDAAREIVLLTSFVPNQGTGTHRS